MNQTIQIFARNSILALVFELLIIPAYLLLAASPAFGKNEFIPWEDEVFIEVGKKHGAEASARMRKVHDFIIANQFKPVSEKLELVNDYMNKLPWIADPNLWKREDYWATPFETIATFGGDCEDIAIAKYLALRLMGIPDDKLGFGYVQTSNSERHMVLVYKEARNVPGLILDNQHPDVLPSTKRRDILAIYAFKNDGSLYLFEDDGKSERKLKTKIDNKKLAKWAGAKERS